MVPYPPLKDSATWALGLCGVFQGPYSGTMCSYPKKGIRFSKLPHGLGIWASLGGSPRGISGFSRGVSGPGPFAPGNVVLTHAGQCSHIERGCFGGIYFSGLGVTLRWCVVEKYHACQCFQQFAVFVLGICFCAFSGFVFCECSGWNGITAMWSYVEKCHAHQCFQCSAFRMFFGWLQCSGCNGLAVVQV